MSNNILDSIPALIWSSLNYSPPRRSSADAIYVCVSFSGRRKSRFRRYHEIKAN